MYSARTLLAAVAVCATVASPLLAGHGHRDREVRYRTRVIASGLQRPHGITVGVDGDVYFSQIPTPGIGGGAGGMNGVFMLDRRGKVKTLNMGEPEPVHLASDIDGNLYWTCRTAGVILRRAEDGTIAPIVTGLDLPTGIAADFFGNVFFTEVPTPGVGGMAGGMNSVNVDHGDVVRVLDAGDPQPNDIAVDFGGTLYWTCTSAGVIVKRDRTGATEVILSGLDHPMGIALDRWRERLFFTEVPTPGVGGGAGGTNKVWEYSLRTGTTVLVDEGDPEPTDVAVGPGGTVYWTCTSAGVIVAARRSPHRW
jgi:hypothetical protein